MNRSAIFPAHLPGGRCAVPPSMNSPREAYEIFWVKFSHVDDAKTVWFVCTSCNE
ncbi:MAG: hypothetical protein QXJ19_04655 [Candidatus Bathyarchaeia archaeon]